MDYLYIFNTLMIIDFERLQTRICKVWTKVTMKFTP